MDYGILRSVDKRVLPCEGEFSVYYPQLDYTDICSLPYLDRVKALFVGEENDKFEIIECK